MSTNHLSDSIEAAEEDFERRSEDQISIESVSEIIDRFIEENGNNTRDALNVALTRLQLLELKVQHLMNVNDEYPDIEADGYVFCDKCGQLL